MKEVTSLNELSGSITASSLTLEDINIDVNPSVGRTSFDYNLFFTNNSQNVSFTGLEYNTFFGTYGGHLDITNGARGNSAFGYHNLVELTTGGVIPGRFSKYDIFNHWFT